MSTLCAYENYLRDRYILGEPVRYMYGDFGGPNAGGSTSKPKQTVYGPDNEEYTYVDDPTSPNAGRYARQIGGNGGGKTVFLDDVQAKRQEQQTERPQNGSTQAVTETNNTDNNNRSAKMESNDEATTSWEDLPSLIRTARRLAYSDWTSLEDGRKKLDGLLSSFHKLTETPVSRDKMYYLETLRNLFKDPTFTEAQSMFESPLFDEVKAEVSRKLSNLQAQKRYHSAGGEKDRRNFAKASAKEIAEWVRNADSKVAYEIGKAALWEARRRLREAKTSEEAYQIQGITAAIFDARLSLLYRDTREVADQAHSLKLDLRAAEKEASEQQIKDDNPATQTKQVDADSTQHGSNVVPAVDEKPKRRPVNKKKEPQRKISFDENASYEELVQKHYPDGKQVDFDDLGYTPSWRKGVITLSDIALAIESNYLTFFDNVPSPTRFNDREVVVLQDPDGNKRRLTSFELFGLVQERLEDNNPEEPYRQEENDVDDALYGYKWVKLPRELRRAVDKRDKTRQINRAVSEAIVVLNDFSEQIGAIAKYAEIPGDLLTGLVDCYLGIEKTTPHHDEGVGSKKVFLSRVRNFLAGVSLARFLADNEDSPARGAAVRLIENFLEAALSKTPKRKFNAIYDKAKELGFSPNSVVDVYNTFYTPAEYSAVKPSVSGESQDHSNIKPGRTDETVKEPEESDTQFDASGLGLPSKSDVALKPDITENKDAAYFIRRDLGEERSQDTPITTPEPAPQEQPRESFNVTSDNVAGAFDELRRLIKTIDSSEKTYKVLSDRALEHEREHVEKLAADIRSNKRRVAFLARGLRLFREANHLLDIGRGSLVVNPKDETKNTFREKKGLEKQLRLARSKLRKTTHPAGVMILEGRISRLEQELKAKRDEFNRLLKGEVVSKVRRGGGGAVNKANEKAGDAKQPSETRENVAVPTPDALSGLPQEQPAKPRPERWTPLKSKMNDDDKRVVENTRKRLNFGLADFAWRIAGAKEKKDWQKAKELTVLAAQRYLEQARRAYRSHGGADALAAFDESLSGEGLTVGQVRDRVVDKFRQLALMNVADLHKYAGERLDEWETFSQGAELPATKDKIALNRLLDKPHYAPNAVPYTPPEKGKVYEVPVDSLNLDPSRFQFKLNTNAQGVTDDLEGAEFDPMQAGIIHVWRDPDDGKDYVVNGHHRFNLAKNSGYDGKVNVRYIDADTADDAKAFGAVANIADSKGTATDVAEFIRTRGSDDIRTPAGKKIAAKNKLLADGRVLSKLDDTIFRKLKNGSIDEKTARTIAAELPDDKEKQLRLFSDIERLGLDASQAQDRAWAYASIQGEKQQGSLFGDDAPMEYDVESRSKLIGEIRKALGGAKRAAQAGGSSRNNEYWESQKLATNFDRDRAKQLSKTAGQTLDFFKDHIRLTGPMQNIIKEETDEYRKAIRAGKGAEKVVERAIERIKDVAQGGDGSVRRVEGLGLEYEDRLPSAKSEQTGQGVEAKGGGEKQKPSRTPIEGLRNGTTGEVLEAGGTDRPSDGGDGRNHASVIAEEAKKSEIPESRVREELSSSTDKDSKKTNSSSASSPEGMSDWERELEEMRGLGFMEVPSTPQGRKRGTGANDARNANVPSTPQTASNKSKTKPTASPDQEPLVSEDQNTSGEQAPVAKNGRGRPRIVRSSSTAQTSGNSEKIAREAEMSEVPKEQVQKRIAEALNSSSAKPEVAPRSVQTGSLGAQEKASPLSSRRYKDVELNMSEEDLRSDAFEDYFDNLIDKARWSFPHTSYEDVGIITNWIRHDDWGRGDSSKDRRLLRRVSKRLHKAGGDKGIAGYAEALGLKLEEGKPPVESFVTELMSNKEAIKQKAKTDRIVDEYAQRKLLRLQKDHEERTERQQERQAFDTLPRPYRSAYEFARRHLLYAPDISPKRKISAIPGIADTLYHSDGVDGIKALARFFGVNISPELTSREDVTRDFVDKVTKSDAFLNNRPLSAVDMQKELSLKTDMFDHEQNSGDAKDSDARNRIAEALSQTAKPETNAELEVSAKQGRKKRFSPDYINEDVEKAIQIRDADRRKLSLESIEYMMWLAQNVSDKHGVTGLKNFMRRIDVTPTGTTSRKLLDELREYLEAVSASRYNAMTINKMAGYQR